jgi:hypothetical protein
VEDRRSMGDMLSFMEVPWLHGVLRNKLLYHVGVQSMNTWLLPMPLLRLFGGCIVKETCIQKDSLPDLLCANIWRHNFLQFMSFMLIQNTLRLIFLLRAWTSWSEVTSGSFCIIKGSSGWYLHITKTLPLLLLKKCEHNLNVYFIEMREADRIRISYVLRNLHCIRISY